MPVSEMGKIRGKKAGRGYEIKFSFRCMNAEILFDITVEMSGRHVDVRDWSIGEWGYTVGNHQYILD